MAAYDYGYDTPYDLPDLAWQERNPYAPPANPTTPPAANSYTGSGGQNITVKNGIDPASVEAQLKQMGGSLYDPTDLEGVLRHTGYDKGGSTLDAALKAQQGIYDARAGGGNKAATTGGSSGGDAASGMSAFLDYLKGKDAQETAWRDQMRGILMGQLGQLQQPVTADSPGISSVIAGQRIASQRAAERAKAQAAEKYASQGLGSSGAKNTALESITQQRGEQDAQFTGQTLQAELNNRRQMLQGLLASALSSGDSQSALAIQLQLQALNAQAQQGQFTDQMAYNYNALNANQNGSLLAALLGQLA